MRRKISDDDVDPTLESPPDSSARTLAPFERDVLTANGHPVRVRPAAPADASRLQRFYDGLSDTSTYYRFFGIRRFIPPAELEAATVHDVRRHVTLVVEADGELIGTGEYHAVPGSDEAEVAFAVTDLHQHEGIGTLLLEDLAMIARAAGFRRLVAATMPGNQPMQRVFRTVGLTTRQWFEDGVVEVQLDLTADHLMQDDSDLRDWRSAVESLRPVLEPTHVVVIGASHDGTGPGHRILERLRTSFAGRVSVVHPAAAVVAGINAARRVGDLRPPPDLAIITVPAEAVAAIVAECGRAGVPAAVIVSDGFAEQDAAGARLQEQVLATARSHGMRILGPNCLGVVSTRCGLDAVFTDHTFVSGGIAIAAQSGGVGIAIASEVERRGAGVSAFVSMGNKVDVSSNDLLRAWADDEATTVVMLYLESFGDPVRFARVARVVSRRKPIVALHGGRSEPGRRRVGSPTSAMADDRGVVDALFEHSGVLRVRTLEELVDASVLFDRVGAPGGSRVAFVGDASGPLILGADAAVDHELVVPLFSDRLRRKISELVPTATTANPVDLTSAMTAAELEAVTAAITESGEVDACIVALVDIGPGGPATSPAVLDGVTTVPVVVARTGSVTVGDGRTPTYPNVERATAAMAVAARRTRWLAEVDADELTVGKSPTIDPEALAAARQIVRDARPTSGWLEPDDLFRLLSTVGIPVTPWRYVRSATQCTRAAVALGSPCVVKGDVDQLLHKSDEDAVILGVADAEEANEAYWDLTARFGTRLRGAVVQREVDAGVELIVGIVRPPGFGAVVVVGAGGIDAELHHDRAVLIAPVTVAAAARAIAGLRLAPLLDGYRGRPKLPVGQLAELVHRLSLLGAAVPELRQLDLDPVIVSPSGCAVVDARGAFDADEVTTGPLRAMHGHRRPSAV